MPKLLIQTLCLLNCEVHNHLQMFAHICAGLFLMTPLYSSECFPLRLLCVCVSLCKHIVNVSVCICVYFCIL